MRIFNRSGTIQSSYRSDNSLFRTPARKLGLLIGLAVVALLPSLVSESTLSLLNFAWIAIIGAISLNLLTGYAGQVSLGQAAFLAIGAYTAVFVVRTLELGMWVGVPVAGLVAAVVGLGVGLPSLRFRGFYLALTTLGLQFIATYVLKQYQVSAGGFEGFSLPQQGIGSFAFDTDQRWYFVLAIFALVTMLAASNLVRGRTGRAWMAVRDRDIAAAIVGVNVARAKLTAFMVSSFIAGVAGALMAYYRGNVSIESFNLDLAISYIAMIIIGGLGSIAGSVIGAVVITMLPTWINDLVQALPQAWPLVKDMKLSIFALQSAVYGLVIVMFLIFESRGLIAVWYRVKAWLLLWPFQRRSLRKEVQ